LVHGDFIFISLFDYYSINKGFKKILFRYVSSLHNFAS